jgi:hypothetical protein
MGAKESKVVKTENAGDSVHSQKPHGATVQVNQLLDPGEKFSSSSHVQVDPQLVKSISGQSK